MISAAVCDDEESILNYMSNKIRSSLNCASLMTTFRSKRAAVFFVSSCAISCILSRTEITLTFTVQTVYINSGQRSAVSNQSFRARALLEFIRVLL